MKNRRGQTKHLDKSLKLFMLTKLHLPTNLRLWITQVEEYFHSGSMPKNDGNLDQDTIRSQHAHLSRSLDIEMLKMMAQKVEPLTPVFGDQRCNKVLESIFVNLYPNFYRRLSLFQMKQGQYILPRMNPSLKFGGRLCNPGSGSILPPPYRCNRRR